MKTELSIICRTCVKNLLRLFFIFPIKKNRIIMSSNNDAGSYTCNPKYICEYLKRYESGKYDIIWAFADPEKWRYIKGIRVVKMHSLQWLYYLLTSKVVIYNRNPESYLPKRKGQTVINTWHAGGAYKKVGFENATLGRLDRWRARCVNEYVDIFLTSSRAFTKSNIEGYRYTGEIIRSGMPRNDLFFRPKAVKRVGERTRERLGAQKDSLVVLYAPTYRRNVENPEALTVHFPYEKVREALEKRYPGRKVEFWERKHHQDFNAYPEGAGVTDAGGYPDMQELLAAADILITDYSSSIWDFALMGKPCLLYVPDLDDYESADRGFFTPIEKWPGIVCRSDAEIAEACEHLDGEECRERAARHLKEMGSYEDGKASERVAAVIKDCVEKV